MDLAIVAEKIHRLGTRYAALSRAHGPVPRRASACHLRVVHRPTTRGREELVARKKGGRRLDWAAQTRSSTFLTDHSLVLCLPSISVLIVARCHESRACWIAAESPVEQESASRCEWLINGTRTACTYTRQSGGRCYVYAHDYACRTHDADFCHRVELSKARVNMQRCFAS